MSGYDSFRNDSYLRERDHERERLDVSLTSPRRPDTFTGIATSPRHRSSPNRSRHTLSSPRDTYSPNSSFTASGIVDRRSLRDSRVIADLQVEKEIVDRRCKELTQTNQALQAEINSLVQKLQTKSSRIVSLTNENQLLQQKLSNSKSEIISITKDYDGVSEKNRELLNRTRELEEVGREMNNMSMEMSMRERDLENQLAARNRDLQLREEVLERNKRNAELLEQKIEELRHNTQTGISTRDEIIKTQNDEAERRAENEELTRISLENQLRGTEEKLTNELRERDQIIERYMSRIKKQAAQLDQMARGIQGLQSQRGQSKMREEELSRLLVEQKERTAELRDTYEAERDEHGQLVRQLEDRLVNYEGKTRKLIIETAKKEKDIESLLDAQKAQINAHQLHQEEWGEKLLRQEIIHEKEKDALAIQLKCRKCPPLKAANKRLKNKLKNADEHIKLLTLSLPRRIHKNLPHWTP